MTKPLHLLRLTTLASVLLTASSMAQAPVDVRVALVIGNAAYVSVPALKNSVNDAKSMGDTLRKLGFTVIEVRDGSKAQMSQALAKAREALNGKQGVGMLYYAGHGLQIDARNYMVPVDAKISKADDVARQTIDVSGVVEAFKAAGNRMNILVLDACRDNPFGKITSGKGLAPLDAPSGTFLAYATAPGNVAEDGDVKAGNGLYTQYLLQELNKPQSRIEDVFKRVRFSVRKASNGRQIPWESTSLEDDFHFNDGRVVAMARPTPAQLQTEFNQEKVDWARIKDSTNPDDFYAFIAKYPNGTITEAAHVRLNALARPTLSVQTASTRDSVEEIARDIYRVGDVFEKRMGANTLEERVTRKVGEGFAIETSFFGPGIPKGKPTVAIHDAQGGLVDVDTGIGHGIFSPPQYFAPPGMMQVGRNWKIGFEVNYTGQMAAAVGSQQGSGQGRVAARETITVPAGTFNAFRVEYETRTETSKGQINTAKCVSWHVPEIPASLRLRCNMDGRDTDMGELVKFTRGGQSS